MYVHSWSDQLVTPTSVVLFLFKIGNTISYQDSSPHILCTILTVGFLTLEQNAWENQHLQLTGLTALEGSGTFALGLWQGWACWQEHLGAQSRSCHLLGSTKGRVQSFKIAFKHMSAGKPHNESPSSEVLPPPMPYGPGGTVTSQTRAIKVVLCSVWVLQVCLSPQGDVLFHIFICWGGREETVCSESAWRDLTVGAQRPRDEKSEPVSVELWDSRTKTDRTSTTAEPWAGGTV